MKKQLNILLVILTFSSCNTKEKEKEAIFLAEIQTPMGWNYLRIYKDHSFQFEHKKLLKSTFYEGQVDIQNDTLKFDYNAAAPDIGDLAIIDGIFLTYTDGIYRELLEVSLNNLPKQGK